VRRPDLASVARFADLAQPAGPAWLADRRAEAWSAVASGGFPGTKDEAWKYTPARRILREEVAVDAPSTTAASDGWAVEGAVRLVFVDGQYAPALSDTSALPAGLTLRPLSEADPGDALASVVHADAGDFASLNLAFLTDGAYLHAGAGVQAGPVHLVHIATASTTRRLIAVRHVVVADAGSQLEVIEHWAGTGAHLCTAVTEVRAAADASVVHIKLQEVDAEAHHVHRIGVHQGARSTVHSLSFALGAAISRTEIRCLLAEPGAECTLDGLYLARGAQHVDTHTHIDHAVPDCTSHELYKGILAGRARGVFTGAVLMRPQAQRSDTDQANHSLLLSDDAIANTRPQLEIHADDVKAAHGATVGRLDADAQFYLQQRGLSGQEARGLLTWAFAGEIVDKVPARCRATVEDRVRRWLEGVV
jgi:Fe-S cluster assembly protein SufD